jgi:NAD(P)-dependent dehydrogenase (short-subunit alcohol dehydrogenase family)
MPAEMEVEALPRGALSGRVAIVVGGASGIGRTAAKALAAQGARIVIADFDHDRMERTVEEILRLGTADAALALPTDVRNDDSVASMAGDAIRAMGRVDILLNMAGVFLQGPLERIKAGDWKWVFDTNLMGVVRTTMALLPHMVERGSGHIVNAVSAGDGSPLTIAYDTCSAAVAAFTRSLAAQMQDKGVEVSLFEIGAGGPRLGQNTRSRGMGRLLHPRAGVEETPAPNGELVDRLIEVLHTNP